MKTLRNLSLAAVVVLLCGAGAAPARAQGFGGLLQQLFQPPQQSAPQRYNGPLSSGGMNLGANLFNNSGAFFQDTQPFYRPQPQFNQSMNSYPGYNRPNYDYGYGNSYTDYPTTTYRPVTPRYSGGLITIRMPDEAYGEIDYTLNGHRYTIRPGQKQRFSEDRFWRIGFARGDGSSVGYRLSAGTYTFRETSQGWELYRKGS